MTSVLSFSSPQPTLVKVVYFCPIEVISDNGQFQYHAGLKWSQEGTYLYKAKRWQAFLKSLYLFKYSSYLDKAPEL